MADPPDTFAAEIVTQREYEAALPQKKDFLPWHRPRKHFVRREQWLAQIASLLDEQTNEGVFRYLGLPGVDLLDVRYFHKEVCGPRNLKLRFLGFNSAAHPESAEQAEMNISLDEVMKLDEVEPTSEILGDDFSRLANESSIAWKKAKALGPYDVINLDLCDGFGQQPPSPANGTYYDAMTKLMSLQARSKSPWLLLLTTRTGRAQVNEEVLGRLLETFVANLACDEFREVSSSHLNVADEIALTAACGTDTGLLPVFLCALCKWLATLAMGQHPPSRVELRSLIGYRVAGDAEVEDLHSIALRFSPMFDPAHDAAGIATPPATSVDECATAVQIARRVAKRVDADTILGGDAALVTVLIDESATLLEGARYDQAAFREWATGQV